jgi:hypothetical protein
MPEIFPMLPLPWHRHYNQIRPHRALGTVIKDYELS